MTHAIQHLVRYLLVAMFAWSPAKEHPSETAAEVGSRYTGIAIDIAEVALDPAEPPVFPGRFGRERTALLLNSLAFHEGRYFSFVDRGECNQPGFKADRRGTCDNGRAFSLWQIQAGRGLVLNGTTWSWWTIRTDASPITGPDLIQNRQLAARVALHMARASLKSGSLCVYTGESCKGAHPNADARWSTAQKWFWSHPIEDEASTTLLESSVEIDRVTRTEP
jgi:hypothetical protein